MSIKIVNRALRRIYAAPIASLDGSTEQKRVIADELQEATDYALRKNIYTDCTGVFVPMAQSMLSPETALPVGFTHAFRMPLDYVRAKRCDPMEGRCEDMQWRVINLGGVSVLATDRAAVKLEYVARPADLDGLPPDVRNVIRLRLALALVDPLNADNSLKQEIAAELKEAELVASNTSDEHDQQDEYLDAAGELLDARNGMWRGGYRG